VKQAIGRVQQQLEMIFPRRLGAGGGKAPPGAAR